MVSVAGNLHGVPDTTRRRVLEGHVLADEIRIFEDGALIATHPVLDGCHQRRITPGHRKSAPSRNRGRVSHEEASGLARAGEVVARRSLDIYEAIGRGLASRGGRP